MCLGSGSKRGIELKLAEQWVENLEGHGKQSSRQS